MLWSETHFGKPKTLKPDTSKMLCEILRHHIWNYVLSLSICSLDILLMVLWFAILVCHSNEKWIGFKLRLSLSKWNASGLNSILVTQPTVFFCGVVGQCLSSIVCSYLVFIAVLLSLFYCMLICSTIGQMQIKVYEVYKLVPHKLVRICESRTFPNFCQNELSVVLHWGCIHPSSSRITTSKH